MKKTILMSAASLCWLLCGYAGEERWWIDRDEKTQWWKYPCDYYFYKNDWRADLINIPGTNKVSHTVRLDSPAKSGWAIFWSYRRGFTEPGAYVVSIDGREAGRQVMAGMIGQFDLTPSIKGKKEFTITIENPAAFVLDGEVLLENGAIEPLRTDTGWAPNAQKRDLAKLATATAYIGEPVVGVLWAPDARQRGERDLAKALGRIQKWQQKIEYDLRRLRAPGELAMLEADSPYDLALGFGRGLAAEAKTILETKAVPAQDAGDYAAASAAAEQASTLLCQAESAAETLISLRLCQKQLEHLDAILSLAGKDNARLREPEAGLKTLLSELRERLKRAPAGFTDVAARRAELSASIKAMRTAVEQAQRIEPAATGHKPEWLEAHIEELGGYLDRAGWELGLDSFSGAVRMLRFCMDGLHEIRQKAAANGKPQTKSVAVFETGLDAGLEARAAGLREKSLALTEELAAELGVWVGAPDTYPSDQFGWIPSTRLYADNVCRYGNDPQHVEFNYTPAAAKAINLAGMWRFRRDIENRGVEAGFHKPDAVVSDWERIYAPDWWERRGIDHPYNSNLVENAQEKIEEFKRKDRKSVGAGELFRHEDKPYNGYAWYRTEVFVPEDWRGADLALRAGAVADRIQIFVNGEPVAAEMQGGNWSATDRIIPASFWKCGRLNTVAIRIFNGRTVGGLAEPPLELLQAGYEYWRRQTTFGTGLAYDESYPIGDGAVEIRLYNSSLSPGFILATSDRGIRLWGWRLKGFSAPRNAVFMGETGPIAVELGKETAIDLASMRGNWLLLAAGDAAQRDLLLVFPQRPRTITWRNDGVTDELTISAAAAPSRVMMLRPFFGGELTEEKIALCRSWARRLPAYPVGASELARMDESGARGDYSLKYRYLELAGPQGEAPEKIAPLPMLCSYGLKHGYPGLTAKTGVEPAGFESAHAPYLAAPGDVIAYSGPHTPFSETKRGTTSWMGYEGYATERMNKDHQYMLMDHYRLTFSFEATYHLRLMKQLFDETIEDEEQWKKLDAIVDSAVKSGITCVIYYAPFHAHDTLQMEDDYLCRASCLWLRTHPETRRHFIDFWAKLAARYEHLPEDAVAFNFWGEPAYVTYPYYNPLMKDTTAAVRAVNKKHKIYIDFGDGWAQPHWCDKQEPTGDGNTHYCFHHYGNYRGHNYNMYYASDVYPEYPPFYTNDDAMHLDIILDSILFSLRRHAPLNWTETGISVIQPLYGDREWLNSWFGMMARWGIGYSWYNYGEGIHRTGLRENPDTPLSPLGLMLRKWNAW